MEAEEPAIWTKDLPIITEIINFPKDTDSSNHCDSCQTVCCFLRKMNFLSPADVRITLKGLEGYYKDFDAVENNFNQMFGEYSEDTISWKMYLRGNSNWRRRFKAKDGIITDGYACVMLNNKARCSIYPNRPEGCREFGGTDHARDYFCDLVPISDTKYGKTIIIKPELKNPGAKIVA